MLRSQNQWVSPVRDTECKPKPTFVRGIYKNQSSLSQSGMYLSNALKFVAALVVARRKLGHGGPYSLMDKALVSGTKDPRSSRGRDGIFFIEQASKILGELIKCEITRMETLKELIEQDQYG